MGGAFGGLLSLLGTLGLQVQKGCRGILWALIGERAYDWSLKSLPMEHTGFKEQRVIREVLGGFFVVIFEVVITILTSFSVLAVVLLVFVEAMVFLLAQGVRTVLEIRSRVP
jgi:hypothetical protein